MDFGIICLLGAIAVMWCKGCTVGLNKPSQQVHKIYAEVFTDFRIINLLKILTGYKFINL